MVFLRGLWSPSKKKVGGHITCSIYSQNMSMINHLGFEKVGTRYIKIKEYILRYLFVV